MLILIAGITGNVGQQTARAAVARGHQIRGLGRSPDKLDPDLRPRLESFVRSSTYYDIAAIEQAVKGVDAVVCAYGGMPELALDGQLLLFRATERAGVKRYLAACWNYDWRHISLRDEEVYDPYICFHAQASISSTLKPCHIFTGILAEVFFGVHPERGFTPADDGVWDPEPSGHDQPSSGEVRHRAMDVYGTGDELWYFTTEGDAGAFAVEVVTAPDAEKGGFFTLFSAKHSLKDVARIYREVHPGAMVDVNMRGSVEVLEEKAIDAKAKSSRERWWEYHRLFFQLFTVKGVWNLGKPDYELFPGAAPTTIEQFLKQNPAV